MGTKLDSIFLMAAIFIKFVLGPAAAVAAEQKSCFDLAENYGASSLGMGGRYTRILCVTKLLWV